MTSITDALYHGTVVHKRLAPVKHALKYSVFSCLLDCSKLTTLDKNLRLFSYNRFNLFSLYDKDHTSGEPLDAYLKNIASEKGVADKTSRFVMLTYPRILGYVFNPLTVYFGLDEEDAITLIIYEVSNTFGGRHSYALPVDLEEQANKPSPTNTIKQQCAKTFYVSPYNKVEGQYIFHVTPPSENLTIGVALKTAEGPLLKTHFTAKRSDLNDKSLLHALWRNGWLTLKVILAIHYEALKLWLKGLRFTSMPKQLNKPAEQK